MQQRLDWIVKPPEKWCHWEPVRGGMKVHKLLRERYPDAECTLYEPVAQREAVAQEKLGSRWWQLSRWKGAGAQVAAPADGSMDMVNYRVQGDAYVVDRLFDRAVLVLDVGSNQRRVTISSKSAKQSWRNTTASFPASGDMMYAN